MKMTYAIGKFKDRLFIRVSAGKTKMVGGKRKSNTVSMQWFVGHDEPTISAETKELLRAKEYAMDNLLNKVAHYGEDGEKFGMSGKNNMVHPDAYAFAEKHFGHLYNGGQEEAAKPAADLLVNSAGMPTARPISHSELKARREAEAKQQEQKPAQPVTQQPKTQPESKKEEPTKVTAPVSAPVTAPAATSVTTPETNVDWKAKYERLLEEYNAIYHERQLLKAQLKTYRDAKAKKIDAEAIVSRDLDAMSICHIIRVLGEAKDAFIGMTNAQKVSLCMKRAWAYKKGNIDLSAAMLAATVNLPKVTPVTTPSTEEHNLDENGYRVDERGFKEVPDYHDENGRPGYLPEEENANAFDGKAESSEAEPVTVNQPKAMGLTSEEFNAATKKSMEYYRSGKHLIVTQLAVEEVTEQPVVEAPSFPVLPQEPSQDELDANLEKMREIARRTSEGSASIPSLEETLQACLDEDDDEEIADIEQPSICKVDTPVSIPGFTMAASTVTEDVESYIISDEDDMDDLDLEDLDLEDEEEEEVFPTREIKVPVTPATANQEVSVRFSWNKSGKDHMTRVLVTRDGVESCIGTYQCTGDMDDAHIAFFSEVQFKGIFKDPAYHNATFYMTAAAIADVNSSIRGKFAAKNGITFVEVPNGKEGEL